MCIILIEFGFAPESTHFILTAWEYHTRRLFYISVTFTVHLRKSLRVFFFLKAAASLHFGSWEMNVIPKTKNSI